MLFEVPSAEEIGANTVDRKNALLTEHQRKFLLGEETSNDRVVRSRIRERVRNGLIDFILIVNRLEPRDRNQIFDSLLTDSQTALFEGSHDISEDVGDLTDFPVEDPELFFGSIAALRFILRELWSRGLPTDMILVDLLDWLYAHFMLLEKDKLALFETHINTFGEPEFEVPLSKIFEKIEQGEPLTCDERAAIRVLGYQSLENFLYAMREIGKLDPSRFQEGEIDRD